MPKILEHKTGSVYGIRGRMRSLDTDSQFFGEQWLLQKALAASNKPGDQLPQTGGVLVNILPKDRGKTSKFQPAVRENTIASDRAMERWRQGCVSILTDIDNAVHRFENSLADGVPVDTAEDAYFPNHGIRHGTCTAYNGQCDFYDLCEFAGQESKVLDMYRARNIKEKAGASV